MVQLIKLIGLLDSVDKIRNLLYNQSVQDDNFKNKKLFVLPDFARSLEFFQNFEPANYTLDVTTKKPLDYFAVSTGNIYRSKWDNLLYVQAQLTRNIGKAYLGDWDDETIWLKSNKIAIEQKETPKEKSSNNMLILGVLGALLLIPNK